MARKKGSGDGNVIPFPEKKAPNKASARKWGAKVLEHGFSIVPSLLFKGQARLGINGMQLAILLHLADFWWDSDQHPWPAKSTVAERLGVSSRQFQKHIEALEKRGYVKRIERLSSRKGKLSNAYDLSGLVERLKKIEPEFREVKEQKKRVTRKGGLKAPRLIKN